MKKFALALVLCVLIFAEADAGNHIQQIVIRRPRVQQIVVQRIQIKDPYVQQVRVDPYVQQIRVIRQQVVYQQPTYVQEIRTVQQEVAQPTYVQQVRVIRERVVVDPPPMQQETYQNIVTGQLGSGCQNIQQEVAQPNCQPTQQLRVRPRY